MIDTIKPANIWHIDPAERVPIPFYQSPVSAGFGNPAENYLRARLSLDQLCIEHPDASYFVEVDGDSMIADDIRPGSILVVDASHTVETGKIIVCWVNGECYAKRFVRFERMIALFPSNPDYLPIYVHLDIDQFSVLGVVIRIVSKPPKWDSEQTKSAINHVRTYRRERNVREL
ncbi:DNA repair protein [Spirosoma aureum]|uniref:DNA repair protein n=1 Tax=Spirosoma aureum TaxID=2692134 RepID=A0A6G9AMU5_9BACT|nr:S24 family peptidase [Spirosoma aureum]QIP13777.1 DNA repair protein [Spirosoma aureum]